MIVTKSQRIKVATFPSVSILRNQGHLRVKDASEKELQDQIEGCRDRFFHHEARCKGLVANFQMLKPLLKNESLKKRLVREGKGNVGSRLVTVLFEACILDCQTLVADNDDFNPSLRILVRPFLSRNRQKNRTLLERLASFHTERPITLNKRQRAARLRRFDRTVDRLAVDWGLLTRTSQILTIVRDKMIAHHELEYDEATNTYSDVKMPTIDELYSALEKAIDIIKHSVANLALVLMDADITLKDFEREIKSDVAVFWDLKPEKESTRNVID